MMVTKAQIEKLAKPWMKRLRLQDWTIEYRVASHDKMPIANSTGFCTSQATLMCAEITIVEDCPDVEQTLVHELLHVGFPIYTRSGSMDNLLIEQGVEQTAWALVERYGNS